MLHTKFQISGPGGSEEEDSSVQFLGSNLGPVPRGHLGPWDFGLNKLNKGPQSNATYQISSI